MRRDEEERHIREKDIVERPRERHRRETKREPDKGALRIVQISF